MIWTPYSLFLAKGLVGSNIFVDVGGVHSFISGIYIAPLQVGLLRGAPNPNTTKYNRLKLRKECLRKISRECADRQREAIPNWGANHCKGTFLHVDPVLHPHASTWAWPSPHVEVINGWPLLTKRRISDRTRLDWRLGFVSGILERKAT